ncbi:hypothetical protein ACFB49_16840 [Sphingomonas sp. DBB INV C78]|uniref:S1 family serine peptidase n=1 Tax=Sphingomonas sp. DBB INV C78 TaxID=3349434 RepID=UPI0036D2D38C
MRYILGPIMIALLAVQASAQDVPVSEAHDPTAAADAAEPPAPDPDDDGGRIVGGYPAKAGSAPWQAQIFAKGDAEYTQAEIAADRGRTDGGSKFLWMKPTWELNHRCGGVLIAKDWIVTAAHCARLPREGDFMAQRGVRLGTQDLTSGGATYRIERVVIHKAYDPDKHIHDIALMRIVPEGPPATNIAPIRVLGSKASDLPLDANPFVTVTGWGLTSERETSMTMTRDMKRVNRKSFRLMEVALTILQQSACATRASYRSALIPETICAGSSDGRDSCNGDSGGPMTRAEGKERVLVGLVSFGYGCGIKGVPALYVNAGAYRQWMTDAMKQAPAGRITRY